MLQRNLDELEAGMMKYGGTFAVQCHGHVDVNAVCRAFRLLCRRHPVLLARIRSENGRYVLYVPRDAEPKIEVWEGDSHTLRSAGNAPWDPVRGVAMLIIVTSPRRSFIGLRADHAIVDGHALERMLRELLVLVVELMAGKRVTVPRREFLPRSPVELWSERSLKREAKLKAYKGSVRKHAGDGEKSGTRERIVALDEGETWRLLATARKSDVSVHGLLCGAILLALRLDDPIADAKLMMCISLVDLRQRVQPQVGALETTNFLGYQVSEVAVSRNSDPILIGREIRAQIEGDIEQERAGVGEKSGVDEAMSEFNSSLRGRRAIVTVTNGGVIREFEGSEDVGIEGFVFIEPDDVRSRTPRYAVLTYRDRLSITARYPDAEFCERDADRVSETVANLLRETAISRRSR